MHSVAAPIVIALSPILFSACVLSTPTLGENTNEPQLEKETCRVKISDPAIYETVTEKSSSHLQNLAHQAVRLPHPPIKTRSFTEWCASVL